MLRWYRSPKVQRYLQKTALNAAISIFAILGIQIFSEASLTMRETLTTVAALIVIAALMQLAMIAVRKKMGGEEV